MGLSTVNRSEINNPAHDDHDSLDYQVEKPKKI